MGFIRSAELVRYNANTRGTNTQDCSVRSISLAFNMDYRKVKQILNDCMLKSRGHAYNSSNNIKYALIHEFNVPESDILDIRTQKLTVSEFADQNPSGTFLIGCSKNPNPSSEYVFGGHLVTIINGKIFDTWDSRNYYVCKCIEIKGAVANIDSQIISLTEYIANDWLKDKDTSRWWDTAFKASLNHSIDKSRRLKKLAEDNDVTITINGDWRKVSYSSLVFSIPMIFELIIPEYNISQNFNKTLKIQLKSTVKPDHAAVEEYLYAALDEKISGIVWSIAKVAEDAIAGYKLVKDVQNDSPIDGFWSAQDKKMFNTLPYWIRRLATDFYIDRYNSWGEPLQRIVLRIRPLPNDTENKSGTLKFDADDKGMLMAMLEHYKETGNYEEAYDIRYTY